MADEGRLAGEPTSVSSSSAGEVSDDTDAWPIELIPQPPPPPPAPPIPFSPPPPVAYPPAQAYAQGYPYQQPGYPYARGYPPYGRRSGMGRGAKVLILLLCVLLFVLIGLIIAVAGGYVRYNDLIRLAGMGPGELLVQNLRDDAVTVYLQRPTADGGVAGSHEDRIDPADVRAYPNRETGAWDVVFQAADGRRLGRCELTVAGNGHYTFMVLPDFVVVSRTGVTPPSGDDFVVSSSSLCRRSEP